MKKLLLLLLPFGAGLLAPGTAAAQVVTIVNGTATSASAPLGYGSPYSANEAIYLGSQITATGSITRVAFDKVEGSIVTPIENVVIYFKTTTATELTAGTLDTTGYQRVFKGSLTNNAPTGYMEVVLNRPFAYTGSSNNLAVLVLRNGGATSSTTGQQPKYRYGFTTGRNSTRRYTGSTALTSATALATSTALANMRLTFGTPQSTQAARNTLAVSLYPNPAAGKLTLQLPASRQVASLQVLDMLGRTVQPIVQVLPGASGTVELPLEKLAAGSYLLRVTQGEAVAVQHFTKE
ncbi:T9SS type A sorting domain-containing protein [Hymenobacter psychrotolerans]|uniref:Por secretion system C-terminal sorting domain-containing protein n=1 Tax=Hymenobacter psychrotolerans DSM 18569 TaxID=1121959 RepID=A0A1M6V521_9BACT|nr:T9SS type A sorting domain-containing protein [Hymenobacter psychrotolerans]SHK76481.1 Por secretion system C-terminal sorting domain-containing protein [Hymenobacter psychrotolerans DSM 18569]